MRKIKFRGRAIGKINDNGGIKEGTWHYGNIIYCPEDIDSTMINNEYQVQVDTESVGEYTGFCDKDGKDIYEGDIIDFEEPIFESDMLKCPVIFRDGMFCANWDRGDREDWFPLDKINDMEIIGNIYENPELLGEPEQCPQCSREDDHVHYVE